MGLGSSGSTKVISLKASESIREVKSPNSSQLSSGEFRAAEDDNNNEEVRGEVVVELTVVSVGVSASRSVPQYRSSREKCVNFDSLCRDSNSLLA